MIGERRRRACGWTAQKTVLCRQCTLMVDRPQLPPSIQREQAIAPAVSMMDKAVSGP
jgi:hypothetical protein